MTQSNDLSLRVDRLENDNIDIKLAISSLIETVNLHQRNFEVTQRNFEAHQRRFEEQDRRFNEVMAQIRETQSEIRGLQLENRRILDRLLGENEADE